MYNYLFGPVPSRRLGMSLGVDLVPKKVCSLDCVYCEVGKTTELTTSRKEYVPFAELVAELDRYFAENSQDPDHITFSGYGEPTLNSRIGDIIAHIKQIKPHIPIAVLTNGTLLHDPEVRAELLGADVVLPSLDAATDATFRRINRPHRDISLSRYIDGLVAFRREFKGKLWLEVFVLPGYNDSAEELAEIKRIIGRINPDAVQLNTLDRPGTVPGLRALSAEEMQRVISLLTTDAIEIIAPAQKRTHSSGYRSDKEHAILETIARRPCTIADLSTITGLHANEINKYLSVLENEGKVETVRQERGLFYQVKGR